MGTSKRYNLVHVKDNCMLFAPTPYFQARAIWWCHLRVPLNDPYCHSNHSKVAKFCITTNGDFKAV